MGSSEKIDFEASLTDHVQASIVAGDFGSEPLLNLDVASDIGSQTKIESSTEDANNARRRLQSNNVEIVVASVVRISFQSVTSRTESQVEGFIGDAFNTALERRDFVDRLVRSNSFFNQMELREVKVAGEVPTEENSVDSATTGSTNTMFIIIGAAAGGFAALVALGLLAFKRRRSPTLSLDSPPEELNSGSQPEVKAGGVTTEILVHGQDEVSTLGDPVFGQAGMMTANAEQRDEQTASVGNDYDYTKQYLRAQGLASLGDSRGKNSSTNSFEQSRLSSTQSGFSKLGGPVAPSVFSDDASFEQQFGFEVEQKFEVTVPPGKLGMVIDTPNGGVPVVHAIKAESCLYSKVKVGDRLVAVDGDDVRAMSAVQVSKLISLKSDQQRSLSFARGGEGGLDESIGG